VLVLNQEHNYHYEVLESIVAHYPISQPGKDDKGQVRRNCDHLHLTFTVSIAFGEEKEFYHNRSLSWYNYADKVLINRTYLFSKQGQNSTRVLQNVIRNSSYDPEDDLEGTFDYHIRASCYCDEKDIEWLLDSSTHYCLFHQSCEQALRRSVYVHPQSHPHMFPSYLPQFFQSERHVDNKTHHLCVIGEGLRREYGLLAYYLYQNNKTRQPRRLHVHHFGIGNVQKPMKPFQSIVTLHADPSFTSYQRSIYTTCDVILSLITRFQHPEYFQGETQKLSGGIVQASAYRKPIVLHRDLAHDYQAYLLNDSTVVETHGDDVGSFAAALERMLQRLDGIKQNQSRDQFETKTML
jgi:hypothetical protein